MGGVRCGAAQQLTPARPLVEFTCPPDHPSGDLVLLEEDTFSIKAVRIYFAVDGPSNMEEPKTAVQVLFSVFYALMLVFAIYFFFAQRKQADKSTDDMDLEALKRAVTACLAVDRGEHGGDEVQGAEAAQR